MFFHSIRDLWIWIDDPGNFQRKLRERMIPWVASADVFYEEAGEIDYALSEWFVAEFGIDRFFYWLTWADHIFVRSGASRLAERSWASLACDISESRATETGLSHELYGLVAGLWGNYRIRSEALDRRVIDGCAALTSWDSAVLRLDFDENTNQWDSHGESIAAVISLTAAYNVFREEWDTHLSNPSLSQLRQLHAAGQRIAARRKERGGGDAPDVPFPGSWQPQATWFLRHVRQMQRN